jgi:hypothetical protein
MTPEFPQQPLPVRRIRREDLPINGGDNNIANPPPRDTVSLADVRAQLLEIKRRVSQLDALLKRATED